MLIGKLRQAFREERLPAWFRWIAAADGIAYWLRLTERGLAEDLGSHARARDVLAQGAAPAFERRYEVLRAQVPTLPELDEHPGALNLVLKGLYPGPLFRSIDWIVAESGPPARGVSDRLRARELLGDLDAHARWEEVSVHLGELLISFTQTLPELGVKNASSRLGAIYFQFGVDITRFIRRVARLPHRPESAIEVLRMAEYLFRVNPEHHSGVDAEAGSAFLEGNACPWYVRPGWGAMHCGIFGRFQDGCSSVFGLNYRLTTTIPKHGGSICRVELRPKAGTRPA